MAAYESILAQAQVILLLNKLRLLQLLAHQLAGVKVPEGAAPTWFCQLQVSPEMLSGVHLRRQFQGRAWHCFDLEHHLSLELFVGCSIAVEVAVPQVTRHANKQLRQAKS
jgi:hypothetical protein